MIDGISIANFKCFKNFVFPLKPLTVVAGGNAVGKSSLIQSLLLLRQAADQLRLLADIGGLHASDAVEIPVRLNGPYRLALGNTRSITNAELESEDFRIEAFRSDAKVRMSARAEFKANTKAAEMTARYCYRPGGAEAMLERPASMSLFTPAFHYLVAERNGPRDLSDASDQSILTTGHAGEFTAHALAKAENKHVHNYLCLSERSDLLKVQLEAWMRLLFPGIQIITSEYPEINKVRINIGRSGVPIEPMSPSNTGFGISYVLPVILSGLLADPGSMLIVENPEAHLHPAAQSVIGRFLAQVACTGVQVLIETHSENVINGVRLAALDEVISSSDIGLMFLSAQDEVTEPKLQLISVDGLGELSAWPSGFFDQQSRDLSKMFALRRQKSGH
jgi:predicted ATPase